MNKLAQLIDKKTRDAARSDFSLAQLQATTSQNLLGDRQLLETIGEVIVAARERKIGVRAAIKMIRMALKANGRLQNFEKPPTAGGKK